MSLVLQLLTSLLQSCCKYILLTSCEIFACVLQVITFILSLSVKYLEKKRYRKSRRHLEKVSSYHDNFVRSGDKLIMCYFSPQPSLSCFHQICLLKTFFFTFQGFTNDSTAMSLRPFENCPTFQLSNQRHGCSCTKDER